MATKPQSRVVVFIDGSNLYTCMRQAFEKTNVDIGKLISKLVGKRQLVKAYYYNAPLSPAEDPEGAQAQERFFRALTWIDRLERRDGKLRPRTVRYLCQHCGAQHEFRTHVQKGVDARIAVDLVTMAVRGIYDIAILVSGDSDFVEAVRFVQDSQGKHVENAFTARGWGPDLRGICNTKVLLDEKFLSDCWLQEPQGQKLTRP
ncbi:MAG: NYN domain-containing protein [Chloroflexi bacterium]|nr:NYN domain-containing protein [Chloroflexota bacterium]